MSTDPARFTTLVSSERGLAVRTLGGTVFFFISPVRRDMYGGQPSLITVTAPCEACADKPELMQSCAGCEKFLVRTHNEFDTEARERAFAWFEAQLAHNGTDPFEGFFLATDLVALVKKRRGSVIMQAHANAKRDARARRKEARQREKNQGAYYASRPSYRDYLERRQP